MDWFRKNRMALLGMVVLIASLPACKNKQRSPVAKAAPPTVVDVLVASTQKIGHNVEVNGTVVANEYVALQPEASGRLIYLNVPEGKKISAGTIIAEVNNADLKAQLTKTKVLLELAEKTEERYRQLLAVNGINESDYDAALNIVKGYKADMEYSQAMIDKTILRAPFDGYVGLRQVSLGAYVSPSTVIATMQQLDKIKIDFTLPEEYADILKIGGTVEVRTDASSRQRSKAVIIAIEPQVNQASRNVTVRAVLQNGKASPGGFVKVYINAKEDTRAVMVPTNSLIPDDKNNQVILVRNGKAVFVNVGTGLRLDNNVEITSGITPGDTVVVTGVLFARPNAPVQIRSSKTLEQFAALNNNSTGNAE
ncbi:MAG TPA: efflux RND transporter periplasmic adaptor subunit [Puia sp.]|nr:efflux RND transporter periplasmic adaptor subunit [Puia sp.]